VRHLTLSAAFVCLSLCTAQTQTSNQTSSYSIRPTDELEITIVGEADLSGWSVVEADGSIIFPLIGAPQAAGLTPIELQQRLAKRLNSFVGNPLVRVEIKTGWSIHPRKWLSPQHQHSYPLSEPYAVVTVRDLP